jgi:hypothetical protein
MRDDFPQGRRSAGGSGNRGEEFEVLPAFDGEGMTDSGFRRPAVWVVAAVGTARAVPYTSQAFTAWTRDSRGSRVGVYSCAT